MWVAEWNEVVFTDESRICLQHHDGRIQVWRHCGERMLNSCVMHPHIGPSPGFMVWGGIAYHSRTPLVRIADRSPTKLGVEPSQAVLSPVWCSNLRLTRGIKSSPCHDELHGLGSDIIRPECLTTTAFRAPL
ncbi:transposable element Tcb1 transposase [Trichonephila clavipes]|uniref:Transposable element Tcb1 transposase n=1 Tax=Trichonephila clavipes TaxID=2585209 RepID=A0A8X6RNA5_TRICX|nr:transposable element Tcb1 transposase [Trichonephila clavipes]